MILGLDNVIDGAVFGVSVCENLLIFYLNKNKLYLAKNSGVRNKFFFFLRHKRSKTIPPSQLLTLF